MPSEIKCSACFTVVGRFHHWGFFVSYSYMSVCICRYIPVLMQQAKIYWDLENYQQVEKIFRKSVEFCNEHDAWKLNVAHVLFMQENKFKEATGFYEPIVKKHYENVCIHHHSVSVFHLIPLLYQYFEGANMSF